MAFSGFSKWKQLFDVDEKLLFWVRKNIPSRYSRDIFSPSCWNCISAWMGFYGRHKNDKKTTTTTTNNRYWLLPSMYQIAIPPASIDASNADTFLNYDMALCWHSMGWWWMWYAAWSSVVDGDKTGWWAATHTLGCTYSIYYRKKNPPHTRRALCHWNWQRVCRVPSPDNVPSEVWNV